MSEWKPIILGKPHATPDPQYTALFNVTVPLEPAPDSKWVTRFNQWSSYSGGGRQNAGCNGSAITFRSEKRGFDQYMQEIESQLALTNDWYERAYLPLVAAEKRAKEAASQDQQTRVDEANKLLEELWKKNN